MSHCRDFRSAGALVNGCLLDSVGASTINLFPLFSGATPETETVVHSTEVDPEAFLKSIFSALPVSDRELGTVAEQFPGAARVVNVNERVTQSRLERTEVYNEYWRPNRVPREALALLGAPEAPLGFIAVCRTLRERPFTPDDLARLDAIRGAFLPKLSELAAARQGWLGQDVFLLALRAALPFPGGLFDERGRVLWLNEHAETKFGIRATKIGAGRFPSSRRSELEAWQTAVVHTHQGDTAAPSSGLSLRIRPIARDGHPSVYLVTSPDGDGAIAKLTAREAELAELAGRGYSVLNIAGRLGISEGTVRNHLKKVYRKLNVCSRAELARIVLGAPARSEW